MTIDAYPICARCKKKWSLEYRKQRWVWVPMCMHMSSGIIIHVVDEPSQE